MVAAFDYCLHGKGGAAPSIDTAMHGLVDAAHVDHLHPDSGIALATAADGEELTQECFGDRVVWVPWRRPGFQLGLDIAAIKAANPQADRLHPRRARHHRLGRHQRGGRGELAGDHPHRRAVPRRATARAEPFGAGRARATRRCRRRSGAPRPPRWPRRSAASPRTDRPQVGHFTDADVVLDFLARREARRAGRAGHLLPGPLPAHQGQAAGASTCPPTRVGGGGHRPAARSCTRRTAPTTRPTTTGNADRRTRPAMRGADPAIVLVPGVGMFSFGKDKQTARVAGEFYVNAINVMRGAEAVSTYAPIERGGEVPHRVLGAGGGQAAADAASRSRWPPGSRWSPAPAPASARPSPPGSPPRAPASSSPTSNLDNAQHVADELGGTDVAVAVARRRRPTSTRSPPRSPRRCWRSAGSTWWSTTPACRSPSRCWRPP